MNKTKIVGMINETYVVGKPEAQALMHLYSTIGELIAKEENSSFMAELVKEIIKNCDGVKGFSSRNLRRMRKFYITYSNDVALLSEAKTIGWTQNTVIMENCTSLEEMAFYVAMVKKECLSKSALMAAIQLNFYETSVTDQESENVLDNFSRYGDCVRIIYYVHFILWDEVIERVTLKYKVLWRLIKI